MKYLNHILLFLIPLLFSVITVKAQGHFVLPENKTKDKINFQLINNLILMPIEVNNVPLTFLLDTGASSTVIFSFEEIDSIELKNSSLIKLRGLGKGEPVDALKSEGNTIKIGKSIGTNQTIYVVFDGGLNFSSRLGAPVHGIIGRDFLKDFVVEINNVYERLRIFRPESYKKKKCRRCIEKSIFFKNEKPHLSVQIKENNNKKNVNLLVDSGSGDALWLFKNSDEHIDIPENAFDDYLGLGINGSIYGKRSKIDELHIDEFVFINVNTAYPDVEFIDILEGLGKRNGSMGGEVLKRFHWTISYKDEFIRLKRNKYFHDPFYYNMSGLTLEQGGLVAVKRVNYNKNNETSEHLGLNKIQSISSTTLSYTSKVNISLEPVFRVAEVRKDSPADLAGIKIGDEILEINGKPAYKYELNDINDIFYRREGRTIRMKIFRHGIEQKIKFDLKDI